MRIAGRHTTVVLMLTAAFALAGAAPASANHPEGTYPGFAGEIWRLFGEAYLHCADDLVVAADDYVSGWAAAAGTSLPDVSAEHARACATVHGVWGE